MNLKNIARDGLLIFALTFAGGTLMGITGWDVVPFAYALENAFLTFVGFFLVSFLTKRDRLRHLHYVALFVWLLSGVNLLFGVEVRYWLYAGALIYVLMILVWGLSLLLFRKNRKNSG